MLASLSLTLLAGRSSVAEPSAAALLDAALQKFSVGEFSSATKLLERASAQTRQSKLLGQIYLYLGVNHEAMKQNREAKAAFGVALRHDPTLTLDPGRFKEAVVEMFRRIKKRSLGSLAIRGRPGAAILIDGEPRGEAPLSVQLSAGSHRIEVRSADGKLVHADDILIAVGEKVRIVLPAEAATLTARAPQPPESRRTPPPLRNRAGEGSLFDWPMWVGAGGAVAAAAFGIGFGLSARSHEDKALDLDTPHDEAAGHHDSATSQATAANVLLVTAGVAAAAVGVWALVKWRRARSRRADLTIGPSGVIAVTRW